MSKQIIAEDRVFITYLTQKGETRRFSLPLIVRAYVAERIKIVDLPALGQNKTVRYIEHKRIEIDANCPTMQAVLAINKHFREFLDVDEHDLDIRFEKGVIFNVNRGENSRSKSPRIPN